MKKTSVNTIPVHCIGIGDTVRITRTEGDMGVTTEGTVQDIRYKGAYKDYVTGEGRVLLTADRRTRAIVELIKRYTPDTQGTLF